MATEVPSPSEIVHTAERQTRPVRRLIEKILNDWSLDLASMLAYNLLTALLPIAITLFGIIGLILKDNPQAQQDLKDRIVNSFPSDGTTQDGIRQVVNLAFDQLSQNAGVIVAIGVIFAMITSSRLFVAIDKCMVIIYRLPERTFLRQTLIALGIFFLFLVIVTLLLAASSTPTGVMSLISSDGGRFGVFVAGILISLAIGFGLFEMIYLLVPNKKMTFKNTWCGALVAAGILELFVILFPLYVRYLMSNYAGQIGFAVILILFFYYFSIILIIGAQINAYFFEKIQPFSDTLGTYLHQMHEKHGPHLDPDSTTNIDDNQQHNAQCLSKLWPFKKRNSIEPLTDENNHV